jgi:uncharacterized repeat protein (TIGR01451 family)
MFVVFSSLILIGLQLSYSPIAEAAPPNPSLDTANVDGSSNEWDLTVDLFADMYRAGDPTKKVESKLYLRYDCATNTMYALVLTVTGVPALVEPDSAWIAIDGEASKVVTGSSGDDGTPPDFAWVDQGFDGNSNHARGWEGSFSLAPGSYKILVHVNVFDDGASQTSAVDRKTDKDGIPLEISCAAPPPPSTPSVDVFKKVSLFDDKNGNGRVNPKDILLYTVTISNSGTVTATGVTYNDTVDPNTSLICSGVDAPTTTQGAISSCIPGPPGGSLTVNAGDIAPSSSVIIEYKVEVRKGNFNKVSNQGEAIGTNFTVKKSDDPDTATEDDPTVAVVSDPIGFIYDEDTGQILAGGKISVTGPGAVTILHDGSEGFYQFSTDGTPGVYTITLTPPSNYSLSTKCLPKDPPPFDPTGLPDPVVLGNGEDPANPGFLTSNACTDYYFTFNLEPGDPAIQNNNFPLKRLTPPSPPVGGDPPIWGDLIVFPTPERSLGVDLNHDGDRLDTVLRYQNLLTGKIFNTGIPVSGLHRAIDLYRETAVFVLSESSFWDLTGTFNLGWSFRDYGPIAVLNLRTGRMHMLDVWGFRPAIHGKIISISGQTIRYYDLESGRLIDTRIPGKNQALWGDWIAYQHAVEPDGPPIIHLYNLKTQAVLSTGAAGAYPAIYGELVAFTTEEVWLAQDLNGDGDRQDVIIRYYDLRARTVVNTGEEGKDVAIYGRYIVFSSGGHILYFDIEAGRAFDTGKRGAEPDIFEETITYYVWEEWERLDLSDDGDKRDPIVRTHRISAADHMLPEREILAPTETQPLPRPKRLSIYQVLNTLQGSSIRFLVQGEGVEHVSVEIYDLRGRLIFESGLSSGSALSWNLRTRDGAWAANGIYLYVITARGSNGETVRSSVKKLLVLRR